MCLKRRLITDDHSPGGGFQHDLMVGAVFAAHGRHQDVHAGHGGLGTGGAQLKNAVPEAQNRVRAACSTNVVQTGGDRQAWECDQVR